MKKYILVFLFAFPSLLLSAQELRIGITYDYLYSKQWDKAIQTYNFSRPFLTNLQPLLINGAGADFGYVFSSRKKIHSGISLQYRYFRSEAKNENLNSVLNFHFIMPGYFLHYENKKDSSHFYIETGISAEAGGLFRFVNHAQLKDGGKNLNGLGMGGEVYFKTGYEMKFKKKLIYSPFASIGFTPYYYSPNTESMLNQTKTLTGKKWATVLNIQLGIAVHFKKHKKDTSSKDDVKKLK